MKTWSNVYGGALHAPIDGGYAEVVNPATSKAYARAPLSRQADVDAAYAAASKAFVTWRETTPSERQTLMLRFAGVVEKNLQALADAEVDNCGKPRTLMRNLEAPLVLNLLSFYAGAARYLEGRASAEYTAGHTSMIRREPVGVCATIVPWNYPLAMAVAKISPAIAMGNTVVLKPADATPVTALMIAELAQQVFPPGVVNVLAGDRETGRMMVAHPTPRHVNLTGSVRAGKEAAASAANDLKRVVMELGGNAPVIVCEDADLSVVIPKVLESTLVNGGQDCTNAHRIIAHEKIHDALVDALAGALASCKTGHPDEADIFYGPMINRAQWERLHGFVQRRPARSKLVVGGTPWEKDGGHYYPPTLVTGVEQGDKIVQDEVFGPLLTVQKFSTDEQAIEMANGVPFGLASAVFTTNHGRALRLSRALEFGTVWVNASVHVVTPDMPHGGFRHSGYGKDLSYYCAEEYTRIKHVVSGF